MLFQNFWPEDDLYTHKLYTTYWQYFTIFKLKFSRCSQFRKSEINKNYQYLQFLKLKLSPVSKIANKSKISKFTILYLNTFSSKKSKSHKKITTIPSIQNISNLTIFSTQTVTMLPV